MSIKMVLFDLDGTLLPMDQDVFVNAYFTTLLQKMAPHGYEPKSFLDTMWRGVYAMIKNDGTRTNEEAFWRVFGGVYGERVVEDKPAFEAYYNVDGKYYGLPWANGIMGIVRNKNVWDKLACGAIDPYIQHAKLFLSVGAKLRHVGVERVLSLA